MKLIVVADIFGFTQHLKALCEALSTEYEIIDPYGGKEMKFESETDAYRLFSATRGIKEYSDMVCDKLRSAGEQVNILGFSAGASAVWNALDSRNASRIGKALCFYGSRIRENSDLRPLCETIMVFPEMETHFSVSDLSEKLSRTENVRCIVTEFLHGFMNRLSANFDQSGYDTYVGWIRGELFGNMQ